MARSKPAQRVLGLTIVEVADLFYGYNTIERLRTAVRRIEERAAASLERSS